MLGCMTLPFSLSGFARSRGLSMTEAAAISVSMNLGTAVGWVLLVTIGDGWRQQVLSRSEVALLVFPATSYGLRMIVTIIYGAVLDVF